jgi:hypothetical protein
MKPTRLEGQRSEMCIQPTDESYELWPLRWASQATLALLVKQPKSQFLHISPLGKRNMLVTVLGNDRSVRQQNNLICMWLTQASGKKSF